jgi:hypothetical protein
MKFSSRGDISMSNLWIGAPVITKANDESTLTFFTDDIEPGAYVRHDLSPGVEPVLQPQSHIDCFRLAKFFPLNLHVVLGIEYIYIPGDIFIYTDEHPAAYGYDRREAIHQLQFRSGRAPGA